MTVPGSIPMTAEQFADSYFANLEIGHQAATYFLAVESAGMDKEVFDQIVKLIEERKMAKTNYVVEGNVSATGELKARVPNNVVPGIAPLKGDPEKNDCENGFPCEDYAKRVLSMQGELEPDTIKVGNVERALRKQGYPLNDIRDTTEKIYQELTSE